MIIEYSNKKIKKICTDLKHSKKKLGDRESINLFKMINFIENIDSVEELINMKRYRLHVLNDTGGIYSLSPGGVRMSIRVKVYFKDNSSKRVADISNTKTIRIVSIQEVGTHYE